MFNSKDDNNKSNENIKQISLITFFTVLISNIIIETQKETKIVAVYLFQRYFNDNVIGYNQKDVGRLKETK